MTNARRRRCVSAVAAVRLATAGTTPIAQQQDGFRFKSGVELINVTATVTDRSGRFAGACGRKTSSSTRTTSRSRSRTSAPSARRSASASCVDTSGSMPGEKWSARRNHRSVPPALPDEHDEFFLYRFSADADLVHDWTEDRDRLSSSLAPHSPQRRHRDVRRGRRGGADGAGRPESQEGGRDHLGRQRHQQPRQRVGRQAAGASRPRCWSTRSASTARDNRRFSARRRRFSAAAADADSVSLPRRPRRRGIPLPHSRPPSGGGGGGRIRSAADDRVNVMALREMTDDSGGRTEIVRDSRDLDPAIASIADELSQQVLPRLPESRAQGRPLAHHPRRSARSFAEGPRAQGLRRDALI